MTDTQGRGELTHHFDIAPIAICSHVGLRQKGLKPTTPTTAADTLKLSARRENKQLGRERPVPGRCPPIAAPSPCRWVNNATRRCNRPPVNESRGPVRMIALATPGTARTATPHRQQQFRAPVQRKD